MVSAQLVHLRRSGTMGGLLRIAIPDPISNSYFPAIAADQLGLLKAEGLDLRLELLFP